MRAAGLAQLLADHSAAIQGRAQLSVAVNNPFSLIPLRAKP